MSVIASVGYPPKCDIRANAHRLAGIPFAGRMLHSMSDPRAGGHGAGEQGATTTHVDNSQGIQVGDHGTQSNHFTNVTVGRDAVIAGRDIHVHVGNAERDATGRLSLDQAFTLTCDVDPLEGSGRADFGGAIGAAYLGGFKFRMTLGNAGDRPIAIRSMKIDVQSHDLPALAQPRPERRYGRLLIAHQLFVELSRDSYSGWWKLSDGTRLVDEPRLFNSAFHDIFESPGSPRIGFALDAGESEFIEGAFLAREPGLYDVKLLALGVDATAARAAKSTTAIRMCYLQEVPRDR